MLRIHDMLRAIEKIERYVESMTFEDFEADERTADAVIRNIGIIGEAANHVPEEIQEAYPDIAWSPMSGMRNIIVHDYAGVELRYVWGTVQQNIPLLKVQLQTIIDNE